MSETLELDGLTFNLRRSRRRRTVGVTVERDASLTLHLPDALPLAVARDAIERRLAWVHEKLATQTEYSSAVFREPEFLDGEGFHFLGRHYRLKLVDAPPDDHVPALDFDGDRLLLRRDRVRSAGEHLIGHYTREAHRYLNPAVQKWKAMLDVEPARYVRVMDLGYRWGSCGANGTLNFHWRTMQLPPSMIEYVVVHELAHLWVPSHAPEFWRHVSRVMPDYRARRQWLRANAGKL